MITQIALLSQISKEQVQQVIDLLNADATIPFIARYRKEKTGGLDEVEIAKIKDIFEQITAFEQRKETIKKSLEEHGFDDPEILSQLEKIKDKAELEDFYLPYKPKRKTKASIAKEHGLEGLAKMMMSQNHSDIEMAAQRFINKDIVDASTALQGARDIIAEWISEDAGLRKRVRRLFQREAEIISTLVKGKEEEGDRFKMYFKHNRTGVAVSLNAWKARVKRVTYE